MVSASETVKYAVASAIAGSRSDGQGHQLDRDRRSRRERLDRGRQAALGQHRGMDAAGELAQLRRRLRELLAEALEERSGRLGLALEPRPRHAHVEREGHQPLLGAVVEVALDLPPRRVGGLDDAGARGAQLVGAGRLHLAPPQGLLGLAPLGDVEDRPVHPEPPGGAVDQLAAIQHPADRAVGAHDPVLEHEGLVRVHRLGDRLHHLRAVVGVDDAHDRPLGARNEVLRG